MWVRAAAVMGVVLALLMVLVAQRIDELWWWSWAFALLEVGTATVFAINAAFGVPDGAPAWPFWLLAIVNGGFGAGLLVGMGIGGPAEAVRLTRPAAQPSGGDAVVREAIGCRGGRDALRVRALEQPGEGLTDAGQARGHPAHRPTPSRSYPARWITPPALIT